MKRALWVAIVALVIGSAAIALVALGRGPEFTTASPEALAELQASMEASMKLYRREAVVHLEKAVELDPDFVLAKVLLAEHLGKKDERREALAGDIAAADLDRLTPRERFLAQRFLANRNERYTEAAELLEAYLARHPDDPWVLYIKADIAWKEGRTEDAERLFQRLIEISPNWVTAYNMLGYITMAQGRFEEAEEYFTSYRFIAPDQANPHDSLGELFIVTGRYDEAVASLEEAVRIKEDFWASYNNLVLVHILRRDFEAAREVLERAGEIEGFPTGYAEGFECALEYAALADDQDWTAILAKIEDKNPCLSPKRDDQYPAMLTHLAACKLGRWEIADEIEQTTRELMHEWTAKNPKMGARFVPFLHHLEGVRTALQGDPAAAEKLFRTADEGLVFEQAANSIFKLSNQLCLVEALLAQGEDAEAHHLLTKVRAVNPMLVVDFEQRGLHQLGIKKQR